MNVIKFGETGIATTAPLIRCIAFAIALSESCSGEIEIWEQGEKVAGFSAGRRVFPVERIRTLAEVEDEAIDGALGATRGNIAEAAELLGIGRTTLYRRSGGKEDLKARAACTP